MFPGLRPTWAAVGLTPEDRAALHEQLVEIFNEIHHLEDWEAHVQPAIDRLKE